MGGMCGRYVNTRSDPALAADFGVEDIDGPNPGASWNIAPTQDVRIVLDHVPSDDEHTAPVRRLRTAHWELVPFWARDPNMGARMINARIETVVDKPAYRASCPQATQPRTPNGNYEWTHYPASGPNSPTSCTQTTRRRSGSEGSTSSGATPTYPTPTHTAGCSRSQSSPTPRPTPVGHVHDRMPLIVPASHRHTWLDPTTQDPDCAREFLDTIPEPTLTPRPVSTVVNKAGNDGPEIVDAVPNPAP